MAEQTYANHRRFVPVFHFVLSTLILVNLIWCLVDLWRHPSWGASRCILIAISLILLFLYCRTFPLAAQDRLIRLEEQLRLGRILPPDLQGHVDRLSVKQFVGLRFASDGEVAELVKAALDEGLSGEQIKKRIKSWRPDTDRV